MTDTAAQQPSSFCQIVRDHAADTPDTDAFTFGDEVIIYAELEAGSNKVARALTELGVAKGERVSFLGKNH